MPCRLDAVDVAVRESTRLAGEPRSRCNGSMHTQEKERKLREAEKEGELQKLPRGPLETLGEDDEVASQSSFRRSRSRNRSLTNLFGAGKSNKSLKSLDDSEHSDHCPPVVSCAEITPVDGNSRVARHAGF